MLESEQVIPALGISLMLAFAAGKFTRLIKVPKVTGYILVGLLLGPSLFNLITEEMNYGLHYFSDIALGLILFNIGGEFHRELLTKIGKRMVRHAMLLGMLTVAIVTSLCFILVLPSELEWEGKLFFAGFLGILAVAAAPPTTLLVIKEYDSKGPLTDGIIVFLALGTLASIIGSEIVLLVFKTYIWDEGSVTLWHQLLRLAWNIGGSVLAGTLLGLLLSFMEQREKSSSEILLGVICTILLGMTMGHWMHLNHLLISLFLGFSLVNFSHSGSIIHDHVKGTGMSIYALFFVFAGAHIDIHHLAQVGYLGLVYIAARSVGLYFSAQLASKIIPQVNTSKIPSMGNRLMGIALLSHAGAALGIVGKLQGLHYPGISEVVSSVIAAVFVFEIIGPIALRQALIRSTEVKVASVLRDPSSGIHHSIGELVQNFLLNTGIIKSHKDSLGDNISGLMTRKIFSIHAQADFEEVVNYIDAHHYPVYPVTGENQRFEGMINFNEIKNVMFDPFLSKFIVAIDLVDRRECLYQDASLAEASEIFERTHYEIIPVVERKTERLVGILDHKSILMALRQTS